MDKKLKILIVHCSFHVDGGAGVIAYNSFKLLQKKGHDVFYFSIDIKPYFEEDYEYAKYFYTLPEKKNFIDYLKNIPKYYYNKDAAKKIEKLLDEVKPDIVHCHTLYGLTYSVMKPCFDRNIPVVKTLHSARILCPSESFFYKNKTYCKNQLCSKGNYLHCVLNKCVGNSVYSSLCSALTNKINDLTGYHKKISKFISPCRVYKDLLVKSGFEENKIEVVPNFINSDFLNVEPNYSNEGYFLYVGRLHNFKGVQYILRAAENLPREIEFRIVGFGPYEEDLKKYCKEKKLDNVRFLGYKSQKEVKDEYKNCIALIVPSICFEQFGIINLEAFAFGKPVIASNIGGMPDIIEHGDTGFLVEPENYQDIVKYVKILWENKELALEMGRKARESVYKYSENEHYQKLLSLYDSITCV